MSAESNQKTEAKIWEGDFSGDLVLFAGRKQHVVPNAVLQQRLAVQTTSPTGRQASESWRSDELLRRRDL